MSRPIHTGYPPDPENSVLSCLPDSTNITADFPLFLFLFIKP